MYIRRAALDALGPLDAKAFPRGYGEENDFCMRALRSGWRNVVDDRTYVFHERNKSFGESKTALMSQGRSVLDRRYPEYGMLARQISNHPGMAMARFRGLQAQGDARNGIKPRALFVVATETGGTPQTNRDLMLALNDQWECWLFRSDRVRISLSKMSGGMLTELYSHELLEPIDPVTFGSFEYDRVVASWLAELCFSVVHMRHLGWHSLNLPRIAQASGAATVMSFHDFHALCPTIKLLDNNMNFCGGVCTAGDGHCRPELWPDNAFPHLKHAWVHEWRARYGRALKDCDAFVTTSGSARDRILAGLDDIAADRFSVIPHGRDFDGFHALSHPLERGEALRIIVPGNINHAKGLDIIEALAAHDVDGRLEFHIMGKLQRNIVSSNIFVHGSYTRDEFAKHVRRIRPHVGAVFSIWDETWCHTLTELWSVGIPTMTFDYSTVAGRVRRSGAGWVMENERDASLLYGEILARCGEEALIKDRRDATIDWQSIEGARETTHLMASRYSEIYHIAEQRRLDATRAFGPAVDGFKTSSLSETQI